MWDTADIVTVGSSLILRLSAFSFLRWIPGHHFPPIILTSLFIYLATILIYHEYLLQALGWRTPADIVRAQEQHDEVFHQTTDSPLRARALYEEPKTSKIRNVLLSGLPHPRLKRWSWVTIAINALLTLLTLDLVFRGPALYSGNDLRFSRVGFVDSSSAKVLFREPDPKQLPIYAYYKADDARAWKLADKIYYLDGETDYTYPITFTSLRPATTYQYFLSNDLAGNFTTPPAATSPAASALTFITSSCIKANFPYNPFSHALAITGFKHLSRILSSFSQPAQFMLFLGDFIYVDVPLRLSSTTSHYRSEYRRVYASPSWSLPHIRSLPWLHTLDDHEIANDWSAGNDTPPYPSAQDPFRHYHVSVNPPIPPHSPAPHSNITYFQFTSGPASFFMLDTRAYRTSPVDLKNPLLPNPNATILGHTQLHSLLAFLRAPELPTVHWKIMASSVPFTKNWRFGASDSWAGFPAERGQVLEAMHFAERSLGVRVVVLSGDRHEFGAIRFPPPPPYIPPTTPPTERIARSSKPQSGPHEFSVGPLSMFYLPWPFRTFRQIDEEDVAIKYIPEGNSKVGVVHIEGVKGDRVRSLMKYSLWVNGRVAWEYVLGSPAEEYWERNGLPGALARGGVMAWT